MFIVLLEKKYFKMIYNFKLRASTKGDNMRDLRKAVVS